MSDQTFGKAARQAWDEIDRKQDTADNAEPGDYVCGDCDRVERDPIFLDTETCSKCGELITAISDELPDCVWKNAETPFAKNH
jgi:hypothetical protein